MEEPQTQEIEKPVPFESPEEYAEAESLVLHPETDAHHFRLGPLELYLRPLPTKIQRPIHLEFTKISNENIDDIENFVRKLARVALMIVNHYRASGEKIDLEWLDDNVEDGALYDLVLKQVEISNRNSFYLRAVKVILGSTRTFFDELELSLQERTKEAVSASLQEATSPEKPLPTSPSAKDGE